MYKEERRCSPSLLWLWQQAPHLEDGGEEEEVEEEVEEEEDEEKGVDMELGGGGDRGGGGGGGQGVEEEVEGGANLASHGESEGVFQYSLILSRG